MNKACSEEVGGIHFSFCLLLFLKGRLIELGLPPIA